MSSAGVHPKKRRSMLVVGVVLVLFSLEKSETFGELPAPEAKNPTVYELPQSHRLVAFRQTVSAERSLAERDPVLLAHRGVVRHAPENTLPAFAVAIELGVSIELDVYQTGDGQLAVIHDNTVDRTTNGSGDVTQMTMAEVRRLDAGSECRTCQAPDETRIWFHQTV